MGHVNTEQATLYGSKTWCLKEGVVVGALTKNSKKAMMKRFYGVKLIDRKTTNELIQMLGVTVYIERMVKELALR